MPTSEEPVNSLGEFTDRVSKIRQSWGLAKHKELWFRGESKDYGDTILRPELYRPPNVGVPLKPIWGLGLGSNLNIQFFGYLFDLFLKLPINLQALLESRDRRIDGRIFETAGKLAHLFQP